MKQLQVLLFIIPLIGRTFGAPITPLLELSEKDPINPLGLRLEILEDPQGTLFLQQVLSPPVQHPVPAQRAGYTGLQ